LGLGLELAGVDSPQGSPLACIHPPIRVRVRVRVEVRFGLRVRVKG